MTAKKYRKKPVEIEAMQWDGTAMGADLIIEWVLNHDGDAYYWCEAPCPETEEGHCLRIRTLEGDMKASKGDFIIKGVQGEFYPCKPDIFAATYEDVSESDPLTFPSAPLVSVSWDAEEEGVPEGYVHHTYRLPDNGRDVTAKDTANITLIPYVKEQP